MPLPSRPAISHGPATETKKFVELCDFVCKFAGESASISKNPSGRDASAMPSGLIAEGTIYHNFFIFSRIARTGETSGSSNPFRGNTVKHRGGLPPQTDFHTCK